MAMSYNTFAPAWIEARAMSSWSVEFTLREWEALQTYSTPALGIPHLMDRVCVVVKGQTISWSEFEVPRLVAFLSHVLQQCDPTGFDAVAADVSAVLRLQVQRTMKHVRVSLKPTAVAESAVCREFLWRDISAVQRPKVTVAAVRRVKRTVGGT
jgi:hypothetical protein